MMRRSRLYITGSPVFLFVFPAGAPEGLVRSRRDDVAVLEGRGHHARSDQAGDVRHVPEHHRPGGVAGRADAVVLDVARVGRGPRHDQVGPDHAPAGRPCRSRSGPSPR